MSYKPSDENEIECVTYTGLPPLRLFTCIDHPGLYPVPVASIVLAYSEDQAREILVKALMDVGVKPDKQDCDEWTFTILEVDLQKPQAIVLSNGDY